MSASSRQVDKETVRNDIGDIADLLGIFVGDTENREILRRQIMPVVIREARNAYMKGFEDGKGE